MMSKKKKTIGNKQHKSKHEKKKNMNKRNDKHANKLGSHW